MKYYIKEMREAAGLTQTQLAAAIGWRQDRFSLLETGKRRLTYETALKIAKVLKCGPGDLFPGHEAPPDLVLRPDVSVNTQPFEILDPLGKLFAELAIIAAESKGCKRPSKEKTQELIEKIRAFYAPDIERGAPPTADQVVRLATTLLDN